jgi:hypothetical protein
LVGQGAGTLLPGGPVVSIVKEPHAGAIASGSVFVPLPGEIVKKNLIYCERFLRKGFLRRPLTFWARQRLFAARSRLLRGDLAALPETGDLWSLKKGKRRCYWAFPGRKDQWDGQLIIREGFRQKIEKSS